MKNRKALHYGTLHVMYCAVCVLYCTVLNCTVLYCTVLYCNVPYCTVLRSPQSRASDSGRKMSIICQQYSLWSTFSSRSFSLEDVTANTKLHGIDLIYSMHPPTDTFIYPCVCVCLYLCPCTRDPQCVCCTMISAYT